MNGTPVKIWARYVDPHAMKEIVNLSTLPFVFHHLAFMPDVHGGKGMPIGGVLATKGAVIPNAVGVDIGCGMCAVKTSLKVENIPQEAGKLWTYLAYLNQQAQDRLERIIDQMKVSEGITEALKASDPIAWVGAMNNIRARAEEIVRKELIFV